VVSVSEPEGFAKPPSHGREVVRSHSAEHPMDQALLDGYEVRDSNRAGVAQSHRLPVPEGTIAGARPLVIARLATDGA